MNRPQADEPLKILLVGNYLPDKQESMQRFAESLHLELQACGHNVQLIRPPTRLNHKSAGSKGGAKWLGYVDKFLLFPILLRQMAKSVDIVHICDHSNAPYVHTVKNKAHLVTCNDVLAIRSALGQVPQNPTRWSGKILQKYIVSGLNRASQIACISRKSREQLLSVTARSPERTCVIYMGQNYPYAPMPAASAHDHLRNLTKNQNTSQQHEALLKRGFILHVGGNLWYKNRMGVLRIYNHLRQFTEPEKLPLLVMGGQPFTQEMQEFIAQHGLDDVVGFANVSNEELRALYSSAQLLLFPSLAEGFGWPIAEAQACGCRVLTTNAPPMTEVGGEAALYCDPADELDAAKRVALLLAESGDAKAQRVNAGLANAQHFSTAQMIDQYINLYHDVIAKRPVS